MSRKFHKFKDAHTNEDVYVDLDSIYGLRVFKINHTNSSTITTNTVSVFYGPTYDYISLIGSNFSIDINENIQEVLALLENRDPRPAKVLFKKKK